MEVVVLEPPTGYESLDHWNRGSLPTAVALVEARKYTPFETALVVPSIVQELAQSPDLLDYCSRHLTHLIYGGGDLPQ